MSFIKLFEEFVQKKDIDTKSKLSFLSEDEQLPPEIETEAQDNEEGVSILFV